MVAASLVTIGVQQALSAGAYYEGAAVAAVGLLVFIGYQVAEEKDHGKEFNDFIEDIGEDNLRALGEFTGDQLRELREQMDTGEVSPGEN